MMGGRKYKKAKKRKVVPRKTKRLARSSWRRYGLLIIIVISGLITAFVLMRYFVD